MTKRPPLIRHDLEVIQVETHDPNHAKAVIFIQMRLRGFFLSNPRAEVMPYPLAGYFASKTSDPTEHRRQSAVNAASGLSEIRHMIIGHPLPPKITEEDARSGKFDPKAIYRLTQFFRHNGQIEVFEKACLVAMERHKGKDRLNYPALLAETYGLEALAGILYDFIGKTN